jgi:hypothetical protein
MKYLIKTLLNLIARPFGLEFVRYTSEQRELLRNRRHLGYKDLLVEESLSFKGEISVSEAIFLGNLVRDLHNHKSIIEIGTLFGRSTLIMAYEKPIETKIITVDNYSWNPLGIPSDLHYSITKKILSHAIEKLNVNQVSMDKRVFYETYSGESPALVFLDAIHEYEDTKEDIYWAKQVNAKIICGHDYDNSIYPGVVEAVNEFGGYRHLKESLWVL